MDRRLVAAESGSVRRDLVHRGLQPQGNARRQLDQSLGCFGLPAHRKTQPAAMLGGRAQIPAGVTMALLELQRLAGNRAVTEFVANWTPGAVQRSKGGCPGPESCGCESCNSEQPAIEVQRQTTTPGVAQPSGPAPATERQPVAGTGPAPDLPEQSAVQVTAGNRSIGQLFQQTSEMSAGAGLLAVSSGFGPAWRVDGGKVVSLTA